MLKVFLELMFGNPISEHDLIKHQHDCTNNESSANYISDLKVLLFN